MFEFDYVLYRIKMLIKILVYQMIMFVTFQFSSFSVKAHWNGYLVLVSDKTLIELVDD